MENLMKGTVAKKEVDLKKGFRPGDKAGYLVCIGLENMYKNLSNTSVGNQLSLNEFSINQT